MLQCAAVFYFVCWPCDAHDRWLRLQNHGMAGVIVLQCVAVCCSVLQCRASRSFYKTLSLRACYNMLQGVAGCCRVLQVVAGCCRVLQCGTFLSLHNSLAMYVLQCVAHFAACCSVLQRSDLFSLRNSLAMRTRVCTRMCVRVRVHARTLPLIMNWQVCVCCSVLQCVTVCCSMQCIAVCCSVCVCTLTSGVTLSCPLSLYLDLALSQVETGATVGREGKRNIHIYTYI